jgi:type 1 fimbria pilin
MFKRALLGMAAFLFAAGVGFAAPQAAAPSATSHWHGYVTDSKCAMNAKARTDSACVKKCVDAGDKYVLYDTATKKVYQLDPQSAVADHAGHHVSISGTMDGDTIHVTNVRMLGAAKPAATPSS